MPAESAIRSLSPPVLGEVVHFTTSSLSSGSPEYTGAFRTELTLFVFINTIVEEAARSRTTAKHTAGKRCTGFPHNF